MSRATFRLEMKEITHNLRAFDDRANDALARIFKYQEPRSEAYMKANAPWHDQTTNARNGLYARAFRDGTTHLLILSHTVAYGIFLETIQSGKWGIIVPSWLRASEEIWTTTRKLFDMMEGG